MRSGDEDQRKRHNRRRDDQRAAQEPQPHQWDCLQFTNEAGDVLA
jgi:hypothetical protein